MAQQVCSPYWQPKAAWQRKAVQRVCVLFFLCLALFPVQAQRKSKKKVSTQTDIPVEINNSNNNSNSNRIEEVDSSSSFLLDDRLSEERTTQELLVEVQELSLVDSEQAQQLFFTINSQSVHADDRPLYQRLARQHSTRQLSASELGLANGHISALAVDDDDLWVGDWQGGITRYSLTTGEQLMVRAGRSTLTARRVNAILVERLDVWVVCSDVIVHYNKRSGATALIPKPGVQGYAHTMIRHEGRLYLGMQNGGLWLFDGQHFIEQSLPSYHSNSITTLFTHENRFYVGTSSGLLWLSSHGWVDVNLLSGKSIHFITPQALNSPHLWVGTAGQGFHRWSASPPQLTQIPTFDAWLTAGITLNTRDIVVVGQSEGGLFTMSEGSDAVKRLDFSLLNAGVWRVSALAHYAEWVVVGTAGDGVVLLHETLF